MAQKLVRASDGKETKPAQSVKKAAEPVKKAAEETAKKPAEAAKKADSEVQKVVKKPQQNMVEAKPTKGSSIGYRIGAFALWALAITCEVFAIMALLKNFVIRFSKGNAQTNILLTIILFVVLDLAFAIIAAQLWKKANRIKPMSEKNKFLFYLWNELGVIMAAICFIPLIILLLKSDKLDKKTKIIATIVAIVAMLITGAASADYNPISAEQKEEAEAQLEGVTVYWTPGGHKYHLKVDTDENTQDGCYYLRRSNTVVYGDVDEAIESGKTSLCSYCAAHFAEELGLDISKMNVEGAEPAADENAGNNENQENNQDEGGAENGGEENK